MSTTDSTGAAGRPTDDDLVCLDTTDGYLLYDVAQPRAWIVSDTAVATDACH